ncbi:MBL fold metallo-hydrolase [Budvicia aquatica]|uniref:MBL fold metallo-hydrolase n=1 Tax=Budvicia aquatica TaxID=82979 RepID=UPI0020889EF7|nr:MBL fold metallo-hydrolase [Budvicia aquatica]GKX53313.1 MBL fold metallo-hydrolase [Budvicia aquatica]
MKKNISRTLLAMTLAGAGIFGAIHSTVALAAAPAQQKEQVPGYYRMQLGDMEVTAIYDGYVNIDKKVIKGIDAKDAKVLLDKMFLDSTNGVQTAVNAYLINTGANLILVDSGAAKCFGPTLGGIQNNIRAAGYTLEQIDTVLLTHLHADHSCGINDQGKMVFPNAVVYAAKADADYWLSPEMAAKAPEGVKGLFQMAQDAVAPYQAAGRFKVYSPGDTLIAGVEVVPTPGHTPGHTSYLFSTKGQELLIWGDIVHSHSIQFSQPEVAMEFDTDSKQAIETRKKLFADVAKKKLWIGGAHLPFPGLGHVGVEGKGYRWVPVEYSPQIVNTTK